MLHEKRLLRAELNLNSEFNMEKAARNKCSQFKIKQDNHALSFFIDYNTNACENTWIYTI